MTDATRYAVVGNPIGHSLSPAIHNRFAAQTGEAVRYERIEAPLEDFEGTVRTFFSEGGGGLNITVPFKQQAWALADDHTQRAAGAGAANTLWQDGNGRLQGDNTDGAGLVRDLVTNNGVGLAGARILLLGAGGAVRGVLTPLLKEGPEQVLIANRTIEKAHELCRLFADQGSLEASTFEALKGPFDVIINGTSASLQGELPPLADTLVADNTVCYDMMYGSGTTAFNAWAGAQGAAKTLDGLGMLVEQAAESFLQWRGIRPDTAPVIAALRNG